MSATSGGYRWDDPYRTGTGNQFFDANTMKGLIYRAQRNDLAAKNHLAAAGLTDQYGNWAFGGDAIKGGDYDTAINQWATARNLKQQNVTPFAPWNNAWQTQPDAFDSAWNSFFGPSQTALPDARTAIGKQGQMTTNALAGMMTPAAGTPQGSAWYTPNSNTDPQWYNHIPAWTEGGGYDFFHNGGPVAKGTVYGAEVGWNTGLRLPAAYNPQADTTPFEYKGRMQERAIARAARMTADAMRGNPNLNAQHYFEYMLSNFVRDAGAGSGFNPAEFAKVGYGEAYDPNKTYVVGGGAVGGQQPGQAGQGGGGQQAPNPTTPGQPVDPTGSGGKYGTVAGNEGLKNLALYGDPNAQAIEFYRQLGLDPNDNGLYTDTITKTTDPILQAWMQFNQINGRGPEDQNAIDTVQPRISDLAGILRSGNGMQQIRQNFRSTMQDPRFAQTVRDLGDQGGINLLQSGMFGANVGANALVSRAFANRFQRSLGPQGSFAQYRLNNLGPTALKPRDWLAQSEWADLLNGL